MNRLPLILIIVWSCNADSDIKSSAIDDLISQTDQMLRTKGFDEVQLDELIKQISTNLANTDVRTRPLTDRTRWTTYATFRWNADSSVVMIQSTKSHDDGFKRETIINIGDTLVLKKKFETLREEQTDNDFELLETVDYLSHRGDLVKLVRRIYPAKLADTIEFKRMNLKAYDGNSNNNFPTEMEYARRIMNRN